MSAERVVFYSHDTLGLGHIRRTQKLANQIAQPDRSILVICSSPKASAFESAPGIEYLNLPGFTKLQTGEYTPRNLQVPVEQFVALRAEIILSAVRSLQPSVFVVDKEPLGVKKELLPTLKYLRAARPDCKIVCGFRDILDDRLAVEQEWSKRDTTSALEQYFDHILIYGEKKYFDFAAEYSLPASLQSKLIYTGYIVPSLQDIKPWTTGFANPAPLVTFTLGGGEDGEEILTTVFETLAELRSGEFNSYVLTGPFAPRRLIKRAQDLAKDSAHIQTADFTDNPLGLFRSSAAVVSMGGYNAMTELMALGQNLLIIPRVHPRREQWIRASIFHEHGFCDLIDPRDLNPQTLLAGIHRALTKDSAKPLPARGLQTFKQLFAEHGPLA